MRIPRLTRLWRRQPLPLIMFVGFILSLAALTILSNLIFYDDYRELEKRTSTDRLVRIESILRMQAANLAASCGEWAARSNCRRFLADRSRPFIMETEAASTLHALHLDFLLLGDRTGAPVYTRSATSAADRFLPAAPRLAAALSRSERLRTVAAGTGPANGLLMVDGQPLFVAACPVTAASGTPMAAGMLVFGCWLDGSELVRLGRALNCSVTLDPVTAAGAGAAGTTQIVVERDAPVTVLSPLRDIDGRTVARLRLVSQPEILQLGFRSAQKFLLLSGLLLAGGFLIVALLARRIRFQRTAAASARATACRLQQQHAQLRSILNHLPDATLTIDCAGRIIACNPAFLALSGLPADQAVVGADCRDFSVAWYGERRPLLACLADDNTLPACYRNLHRRGDILEAEVFAPKLHQGRGTHLRLAVAPFHDSDGRRIGTIECIRDITREHTLREQFLHNEKLAAMGRLSAAVAHELNQPLGAIRNYCQDVVLSLRDGIPITPGEIDHNLRHAVQQVDRLAEVIRNMRQFTRPVAQHARRHFPARRLIDYPLSMMRTQLQRHGLEIVTRIDDSTGTILGNEQLLLQAVITLLASIHDRLCRDQSPDNAVQLTITLARITDTTLTLTFADNGPAIPDHELKRWFEPFHTTGDTCSGELSLSLASDIARQHGGSLTVTFLSD